MRGGADPKGEQEKCPPHKDGVHLHQFACGKVPSKSMCIGVGWSAGRHVDHLCGWQTASKVTEKSSPPRFAGICRYRTLTIGIEAKELGP